METGQQEVQVGEWSGVKGSREQRFGGSDGRWGMRCGRCGG